MNEVPWATLLAGDVINIYYKSTPYKVKFGLRAQGTEENPVVVNGVTDASGNRPVIDGNGARTAPTCSGLFSATPEWGESLGVIVIIRGNGDNANTYKPHHIKLNNLRVIGSKNGNNYTTMAGAVVNYDSGAGIYIHVGDDITVENCDVTENGFGIFTMAKSETMNYAGRRIHVLRSRIYGNGVVGSYLEHNLYIQADSPIIDGNFIGQTMPGSEGSSFKDRSARLIFRNNYVIASARAVDFVHSEEQSEGIAALPYYGYDYVYNNYIDNPSASSSIHFGGDNWGEQDGDEEEFNPPAGVIYRKRLFFWNNVVNYHSATYRNAGFDLSLQRTIAEVWNNTFTFGGTTTEHTWLEYAGQLRLNVDNVVTGPVVASGSIGRANPIHINITYPTVPPTDDFLTSLLSV